MNEKLYAFWSYDKFPYVLGGTVTKMHDDGTVETKEYGQGSCFTPIKIVPFKAGIIIKQDLDKKQELLRISLNAAVMKADEELKREWCFIK